MSEASLPLKTPSPAPRRRHWPGWLRRGPWEWTAMILIGLGVIMMMQPFALTLFTWSFPVVLVGTALYMIVSHFPEAPLRPSAAAAAPTGHGAAADPAAAAALPGGAEIRVENLHKSFGDFVAVKDSTFTIRARDFFVLLGPSGCGKTTTLRMIAGLELPTSGRILLGDRDVTMQRARDRDIAFVFQLFALYPHMSVRRNIGFPLMCEGVPRAEIRARVEETARLLRIDHLLDRPVGGLAGGDRQRVALGRAIVRRPKAFLMDEPLGTLDAEFRELMCEELRALHDRIGATTVYVTHDQLEAMSMADTIAVMNHGVVEQFGPPQLLYDDPATRFVASFLGSPAMNFLDFQGTVSPEELWVTLAPGVTVPIPAPEQPRGLGPLTLGVRPEHILVGDTGPLAGTVAGSEYLGTTQIVTIDTAFGALKARLSMAESVADGAAVRLSFLTERLSLFDGATGRAIALSRPQRAEAETHG